MIYVNAESRSLTTDRTVDLSIWGSFVYKRQMKAKYHRKILFALAHRSNGYDKLFLNTNATSVLLIVG